MTEDEVVEIIKKMKRRHEMLIKFCLMRGCMGEVRGMLKAIEKFAAKGLTNYKFSIWVEDNLVCIEAHDIRGGLDNYRFVNSVRDVKVFMKQYRGVYFGSLLGSL